MRSNILIVGALAALCLHSGIAVHVDRKVPRALKQQGTVSIIVTMEGSTQSVLESFQAKESTYPTREAKNTEIVNRLVAHATESQADVAKLLAQESSAPLASEMRQFWITNQLYFRDATYELVEKLASTQGVASVEEELVFRVDDVTASTSGNVTKNVDRSVAASVEWGVQRIQAPAVWASGNRGEGIVVASIDSGVRGSHEALRGSWRREFGWFDPNKSTSQPNDNLGHGTHTVGTIVGAGGIGVAPGAQWIACKVSRDDGYFYTSDILSCGQFVACPTDPTGATRDCAKAPHIVSNSWSINSSSVYNAMVVLWRMLSIIPVFSMGNAGPTCTTGHWPANYEYAIGVGSTTSTDSLSDFSSKGPTPDGIIKPDLSAPGERVRSAFRSGDSDYLELNGTSMATPHVSGVIALMLAANKSMDFDGVRKALTATTETASLQPVAEECGGTKNGVYPNNMYGYGRLNAYRAVHYATKCGGLAKEPCEGKLFCSWNALQQICQQWW